MSVFPACVVSVVSLLFYGRFILHAKKTAFVVEHDFIMATYLADRVVVLEGIPSVKTMANAATSLLVGMNRFLGMLNITFRRDSENYRPRINKSNSVKVCILPLAQLLSCEHFLIRFNCFV